MGSVRLQDSWVADANDLAEQLADIVAALAQMAERAGDEAEIVLGVDWNAERVDLETETDERAAVLAAFARRHRLEVPGHGCGTWRRPMKELDYWLLRGSWRDARATAERTRQVRSDYTPAAETRTGRAATRIRFRPQRRKPMPPGWRPSAASAAAAAHRVTTALGPRPTLDDVQRNLTLQAQRVSSAHHVVVSAGVSFDSSSSGHPHANSSRVWPPHACSCDCHGRRCDCAREGGQTHDRCAVQEFKVARLRTRLAVAVRRGTTEQELIHLRRTVWGARLRRAQRRRRRRLWAPASRTGPRKWGLPTTLESEADRQRWPALVADFLRHHFAGPPEAVEEEQAALERWRAAARAKRLRGHRPGDPTADDLETALRALNLRAAAGADGVGSGLFDILGPISRLLLLRAMCDAVAGRNAASAEAWATSVAQLVPQLGKPQARILRWRPISLLCALAKVFDPMLWVAMDRTLRPLPPPAIGICPGRQPLEIAGCISVALAKATERQQPLCVISMGVKSACHPP